MNFLGGNMKNRLDVENPFYDGDASASAFGWRFQIDAAIFLFLYYIDEVEKVIVEGRHQDIELYCKNEKHIFAQAKSIQNGSLDNRSKKLEDAVISLAKTSADTAANDSLLYISNYEAPISRTDIFKNKVVKLKNVSSEKEDFKDQIERICRKLEIKIQDFNGKKREKLVELLKRIKKINVDEFMVSAVYPYIISERPSDLSIEIENKINEILTIKYNIQSVYLRKIVSETLLEWHETFLYEAAIPNENKYKAMSKEELLWQIVIVLSKFNDNSNDLYDEELDLDLIERFETNEPTPSYQHTRFSFFNRLVSDCKNYRKSHPGGNDADFIKNSWKTYIDEYKEFSDYPENAKEYYIKKNLAKLINNKNNIKCIIDGEKDGY